MTINLADNNPRINYSVASGVTQTVFSVPFDFFEDSDVSIYVDGTLKVEGTDYTLTGGDGATGTLTFVTATPPNVQQVTGISGGTTVSIVRHVALKRVTDFATGQNINRTSLNEQLDTIVAQVADLDSKVDRTIHLTDSELAPSMLLTSDRKGRVLAFDSTTGDVEAGPLSNDINTIATNITEILDANNQAAAAAASATAAATSATTATTAKTAAELAKTNAETAESNAATSATNADTSETNASTSASTATTKATEAATSATNAANSATAASLSKTAAATSESNASTSETNAATSETSAATSATTATTKASEASTSATGAATSETNAATSATTATTKASEASTSETNAATSASTATTKASEAATSATNSATSATESQTAKTAAEAAKDAALAALDSFDDRYLGAKASDPTLDNDGNALVAGALYYNTTDDVMKVYEGSSWVAAYASLSGALLQTNNLSDLADAAAARTNLGLGTAAATASTDYATAAQGTLADSAVQPNDSPTFAGLTTTADVSFGDNDKAIFGASSDLQIYHDGSNSYITDASTGDLIIDSNGNAIRLKGTNGENMIVADTDSSAKLFYDGSQKLATTSTGMNVTGTVTADELTVNGVGQFIIDDTTVYSPTTDSIEQLRVKNFDTTTAYTPSLIDFQARGTTTTTSSWQIGNAGLNSAYAESDFFIKNRLTASDYRERMRIEGNGDISFYEDTGTTPKFFWDASAESLGIGTSSPSTTLQVEHDSGGSNSWTNAGSTAMFTETNAANPASIKFNPATAANGAQIVWGGAAGDGPFVFKNYNAERMVIDSSGNVGIGTTSPTSASGFASFVEVSGSSAAIALTDTVSATPSSWELGSTGGNLKVQADGTERMRIDASGNVGIGTTSPTTELDVDGTITATSYSGDGSSLTGIAAGAGGGGSDEIFWENGQNVTSNYTITNGKNAMSAGPITIDSGVTVTVGAGETWTVV